MAKARTITARVSEEEYRQIEENAAKHGMKISPFIIKAATRDNMGLTPQTLVRLEHIRNIVTDISRLVPKEYIEAYEREVHILWQSLNL